MAPLRHYAAYLRPRMFPATFIMALTGWAASPTRPRQLAVCARQLALLFVVHSVLLWGGTNAYNSSQDRDAGPVNLLPNPPPLPPRLDVFGVACMALAVAVATLAGARAALLTACAIPLSIYYSIKSGKPSGKPPARAPRVRRGKDIGGVDNAIYAVGGAGSILLGWCITGAPLDARAVSIAFGFALAIFGGCPTTQIFQLGPRDDYATSPSWTTLLGARRTLIAGAAFFAAHVAWLARAWPSSRSPSWWLTLGWASLVALGAAHSVWWSRAPFVAPYRRMVRQMSLMLASQLCWTGAALTV